jgi:hypothetical protein
MSWTDKDTRRNASRSHTGMRMRLSDGQLIGAIFIGLCTLGAAFITGAFGGPRIGLGSGDRPTPIVTITRTVTAHPSIGASSSTLPHATTQPNPTSGAPAVPLLTPVISQPGWTLAWHQKVSIGAQGMILGTSGPDMGDGSNYDLQYVPGSNTGWGDGGNVADFDYWSYNYSPGPATIHGVTGNSTGGSAPGSQAHLGDRLYVTLWENGSIQVNRIAYMQVVAIGTGYVIADMWVWNAS